MVIWLVAVLAVLAVGIVVWSVQAMMEAKSFNRLTGANVSTWDAMWVELRVDVPVQK